TSCGNRVTATHIVAEKLRARARGQAVSELLQVSDVVGGMIGMRKIRRPKEAVGAIELHQGWDRALIRIAGDPTLAAKIRAGLPSQRYRRTEKRGRISVNPIEPVADPTSPGLEEHDLQSWKAIEDGELEQTGEGMADGVRRGDVEKEMSAVK